MTDELFDVISITVLGVSAIFITEQVNSIATFMFGVYTHIFLQSIRTKNDIK